MFDPADVYVVISAEDIVNVVVMMDCIGTRVVRESGVRACAKKGINFSK